MKIIDEYGNEVDGSILDMSAGYLVESWIRKEGISEVDFVTKHEYEDDDFEKVLQYVPMPLEELKQRRIIELKQKLSDTDYLVIKVVEGLLTLDDISDSMMKRAAWRAEINELEGSE